MERRKFLGLSVAAFAALPVLLSATDFRATKPDAWTAKTVEDAIKALYGSAEIIEKDVKVKAPKVASNGGAVPVTVQSDIPAKTVTIFQDANPESAVATFELNEYSIIDFGLKIKMKQSGTITAVVEGTDGKLYVGKQTLEVALGGCEG
ncbi:MAG TPA: thiosulfate oxidation carrier protein SoxY [Sulfurovum sp. UBA12169]|jgi:Predicted secreted protein|nr:MAG TPA: thiosulfate oxidation carrier protein SoxY [Sulfurovum sp. UBA12169]